MDEDERRKRLRLRRKKRLREENKRASLNNEASYLCDSCGEEIVIPVDRSAGDDQRYVEDCPVCCNPNVVHVTIDEDGEPSASARAEQDRS